MNTKTRLSVFDSLWARFRQPRKSRRGRPLGHLRFCSGSAPARILEDESRIVVESDVTGSTPDDIDIVLSEELLAIRASPRPIGDRALRRPALEQSFALPRGIDLRGVRAELRNSLLRVILPWSPA